MIFTIATWRLDTGQGGPEILQLAKNLCRGLSGAMPVALMQSRQDLVVSSGTVSSLYVSEARLVDAKICCERKIAPDDGTMQIAIKTGADDHYEGLSLHIFSGRKQLALPFDSTDELKAALEEIRLYQKQATIPRFLAGGRGPTVVSQSKPYPNPFSALRRGRTMSVDVDGFADKECEYINIYKNVEASGRSTNNQDFMDIFTAVRLKVDAARRVFALVCLNCAEDTYFVRDCPRSYFNYSGKLNPDLGPHSPAGIEARWHQRQQRFF